MNKFYTRALTAVVFAVVLIGGLILHPLSYFLLVLVILIGSLREFYTISKPMFKKDRKRSGFYMNLILFVSVVSAIISALITFNHISRNWIFSIPLFVAPVFYMELVLRSKKPFRNIGLNLVALYYITLPLALSMFLANIGGHFSGAVLLGIFFIIWANDTGAYIIGSLIGKNKLIPHVSPNKTIEGFVGGGLFCFLIAYCNVSLFSRFSYMSSMHMIQPAVWYLIAGVVFIFATMGDLVESLLKRSLEIKDSGSILPGHGGFLDRFDAFLFVLPFVVAIIEIFN